MTTADILLLMGLLGAFVFITGSIWHFVAGEIEYRRYSRTNHMRSN